MGGSFVHRATFFFFNYKVSPYKLEPRIRIAHPTMFTGNQTVVQLFARSKESIGRRNAQKCICKLYIIHQVS